MAPWIYGELVCSIVMSLSTTIDVTHSSYVFLRLHTFLARKFDQKQQKIKEAREKEKEITERRMASMLHTINSDPAPSARKL